MKGRDKRGENQFQQSWKTKYDWIKYKSATHITCILCNKDVAYNNMGEPALKSHAKPNGANKNPTKHQMLAAERERSRRSLSVLHFKDLNTPASSSSSVESSTSTTTDLPSTSSTSDPSTSLTTPSTSADSTLQATLEQYVVPVSVAKAEILWSMKVLVSHFSLHSCLGITNLFRIMFNDSEVARVFSLSKTKCGYYINFGIAPYYRDILIGDIRKSPYYTVLFDETLNKIAQAEQLDVYIRYWSEECNSVKTRYFDSQFLLCPNADNIAKAINNSLNKHKLLQDPLIHLGMDGPSTNWLVLKLVAESREENALPPVEIIGACGLHIVSGALQTGAEDSG